MRSSFFRLVVVSSAFMGTASISFAQSQSPDPQAIRAELDRLRQEFDVLRQQYSEQFGVLEARLAAREGASAPAATASLTARILEIPTGQITRAMGDVHPLGNPHYWLEPGNGRRIAQAIAKKLAEVSPADAAYFNQRYADFDRRLAEAEKRWDSMMAPHKGLKIVSYHQSWPNFAERFGLDVIGYVEPRPGIPPSAAHSRDLIQEMRRQNVRILLVEPYFDLKTPNAIARETGARVVVMPPSVGGMKEAPDYLKLFDYNIELLITALKQVGPS